MRSPFDGLQIEPKLVAEFFGVFSRFEYAMKASGYCKADRWKNAIPDWEALGQDIGPALENTSDECLERSLALLLQNPPQIQRFAGGDLYFEDVPLRGDDNGAKTLDAAKRVRNNLFHGGKHGLESSPGRDTQLIGAALTVLQKCLELHPNLKRIFDD